MKRTRTTITTAASAVCPTLTSARLEMKSASSRPMNSTNETSEYWPHRHNIRYMSFWGLMYVFLTYNKSVWHFSLANRPMEFQLFRLSVIYQATKYNYMK